jgi:hypothetical protein
MKADSVSSRQSVLSDDVDDDSHYHLYFEDGTLVSKRYDNNRRGLRTHAGIWEDGWIHIVATIMPGRSSPVSKLYINGILVDEQTYGNAGRPAFYTIGCQLYDNTERSYFFKGLIDDLMVFKEVLSDSEVEALFQATKHESFVIWDGNYIGTEGDEESQGGNLFGNLWNGFMSIIGIVT